MMMEVRHKNCMSVDYSDDLGHPLKKLLQCSICNNFFKTPVELKCGHIFCKCCINIGKSAVIKSCPMCNRKMPTKVLRERNDIQVLSSCVNQMLRAYSDESDARTTTETSQISPLDLSMKNRLELFRSNGSNTYPIRTTSAIHFIKPLDLTWGNKSVSIHIERVHHRPPVRNEEIIKSTKQDSPAIMQSPALNKSSNEFESEYDVALANVVLSNEIISSNDMGIEENDLSNSARKHRINSPIKQTSPMNQNEIPQTGKRALSVDDVSELCQVIKMPRTDIDIDEVNKKDELLDFANRNANQTEETYFSEEKNDEIGENSDSEASVLAETPVRDTNSKRKSLREIHSVVASRIVTTKESESSADSDPIVIPKTSTNRQTECSEVPFGMFEVSFDKIEEIQPIGVVNEIPLSYPSDKESLRASNSLPTSKESKFLFCPTRLSRPQVLQLQKLCEMCKGNVTKEYNEDVTHLIINLERDRVPQTMKYLFAIAGKKWVVTFGWVNKCLQEGRIVPEEPFETASFPECDMGVRLSRLTNEPLFQDFNFYIGGTMKSSGASVEDCKKLLLQLGGNIIVSPGEVNENVMILGDPFDQPRTYQYWYRTKGFLTVSWEWVLDCILTFSLVNFAKNHLITNLNGTGLSQAALPRALLNIRQV